MTVQNSELKKLVRSPEGFDSLGACLMRILQRGPLLGLFCFSEFEREIFVYPPVTGEVERRLLGEILGSPWREDPMEVFPRIFEALGVRTGPGSLWVQSSFLSSGSGEKPIGAYAFVYDEDAPGGSTELDFRTIDTLLTELMRSRMAIHKYRESFQEGDYLFALINKVGRLLLNPANRGQSLVTLLEMATHVASADVGLLMIRKGEELVPEVELGLSPDVVRELRFLPEGDSLIDRLMTTHQPVIVDDFSGPTVQVPHRFQVRINGLAAVPLVIERKLLGIVCLAGGDAGRSVSKRMIESLEAITAVIGMAVENELLRHTAEEDGDGGSLGAFTLSVAAREAIEETLERAGVGIIVGDEDRKVIYSTPLARELLDDLDEESPAFGWLLSQWMIGGSREIDFPYRRLSGAPVRAFTCEVGEARSERRSGCVTVLVERPPTGGALHRILVVDELRRLVSRLALGVDLVRLADDTREGADEACRIVSRALAAAERMCVDLDLGDQVLDDSGRRACQVTEVLQQARRQVEAASIDTVFPAEESPAGRPVVLADPYQLRLALERVLVQVDELVADDGKISISTSERDGRVIIRVEFEERPETAAQLDPGRERGRSARGRDSSIGMQTAARILSGHRGTIANGRCAGGARWIEVRLPAAPDAAGTARHDAPEGPMAE